MTERKNFVPGPKEQLALQRHTDYYIGFLMNPENDREKIYPEMGQIKRAVERVRDEIVSVKFHPGQIEIKYLEMVGGYAQIYLPILINGEVTRENFDTIETAVQMVESGEVDYPVNSRHLRSLLETARKKLFEPK